MPREPPHAAYILQRDPVVYVSVADLRDHSEIRGLSMSPALLTRGGTIPTHSTQHVRDARLVG